MLVRRASLLRARKNYGLALSVCEEAIKLDPQYPWAHVLLDDLHADRKNLQKALEHLEFAADLAADNPNIRQKLEKLRARTKGRIPAVSPAAQAATAPAAMPAAPTHAVPAQVSAQPPREEQSLRLAYSMKEKTEGLLARLEELRNAASVSDDEYAAMRARYQDAMARATSQVETLKTFLRQRLDGRQQESQRLSEALEKLQAEAEAGGMPDYQINARRSEMQRQLAMARAEVEAIEPVLAAETSADLGGFVNVNLDTGEPEAEPLAAPVSTISAAPPVIGAHCECGAILEQGARFCDVCGRAVDPDFPAAGASVAVSEFNTSGLGVGYPPPEQALRWNWGAFLLDLFWAPAHGLWGWFIALLLVNMLAPLLPVLWYIVLLLVRCLPLFSSLGTPSPPQLTLLEFLLLWSVVTLPISIYLGLRGGRLAWARRRFHSVEQFCDVQRAWGWGGLVFLLLLVITSVIAGVIIGYMLGAPPSQAGGGMEAAPPRMPYR
jgi:hypothetical protein